MDVNDALIAWLATASKKPDVNSLPYRQGQWTVEAATQRVEARRLERPTRRQS